MGSDGASLHRQPRTKPCHTATAERAVFQGRQPSALVLGFGIWMPESSEGTVGLSAPL